LAEDLVKSSGVDGKLPVSIGNFLDGDSENLSPHSAEVKEELTMALSRTGKFEVITRERLSDIQNEGKFQSSDLVKPGADSEKVLIKPVEGIVRGRIYAKSGFTVVYAGITYLKGGEIREVKAVIADPPSADQKVEQVAGSSSATGVVAHSGFNKISPEKLASPEQNNPLMDKLSRKLDRLSKQVQSDADDGLLSKAAVSELTNDIKKVRVKADRDILQNDGILSEEQYQKLNWEAENILKLSQDDKVSETQLQESVSTPSVAQSPGVVSAYTPVVSSAPVYAQYAPTYYAPPPVTQNYVQGLASLLGVLGAFRSPAPSWNGWNGANGYAAPVHHWGGRPTYTGYSGGSSYYKH
jgi:hypothetical protein